MSRTQPRIGVTLGDPAGIGPEILAKSVGAIRERCDLVVFGTDWALEAGYEAADLPRDPSVELVDIGIPKPAEFQYGQVSSTCGLVAVAAVETAARAAIDGSLDALMTCPLNKEAINAAGVEDIGHQEILGRMTSASATATMLMTPGLRVVHLSTHKSLADAVRYISKDTVLDRLILCDESFRRWGLASPRIAVAAVNPHGGEGGLMGREEIDEIAPAVAAAQDRGIDAYGPYPADSVFNRAVNGEFDVVLAMYHDQGHIAIKVHNFHESISATLGIPFVRTSVDHGTAFDIAGRGIANPKSTVAAIDAAIQLSSGQMKATSNP